MVELDPASDELLRHFPNARAVPSGEFLAGSAAAAQDYVVLNGVLHSQRDIQTFLERLRGRMPEGARLILTYYSSLWKPAMRSASALGVRSKTLEPNWLSHEDVAKLLCLAGFEAVRVENRVLLPVWVPLVSDFVNRYLAPLPFFRLITMVNVLVARPVPPGEGSGAPSVSVVVPARNEAGNIEDIVRRIPAMGPDDEIIFVEGNSTDDTWEAIRDVQARYGSQRGITIAQQPGKGKGDAVRTGFDLARNDICV